MELDATGTYADDKGDHKTGFDAASGTLYLYFKSATSIEAGKPYIVKWGNTEGTEPTENPVFSGVTVSNTAAGSVVSTDGKVQFVGCYSPDAITVGNKATIYLGAENKLYWPNGTNSDKFPGLAGADDTHFYIGACRAYFKVDLGGGLGVWPASASVRAFNLSFGEGEQPLSISPVGEGAEAFPREGLDGVWYDLQGRKFSAQPTRKGLYIHGGRKVAIK